jgi:hypothetical protein
MPSPDGCWLWIAAHNKRGGYGRIHVDGRIAYAHRVVYEMLVGPIENETLDHLCRQPACVNPKHLEPVSYKTNARRGVGPAARNSAKTKCRHGHPFDDKNTYWQPNGTRRCRRCSRRASLAFYERNPGY